MALLMLGVSLAYAADGAATARPSAGRQPPPSAAAPAASPPSSKATAKTIPIARYDSAIDRFGELLETYLPVGKWLYVRTPDANEASRLSDAPADARRPAEIIEYVRIAASRIGSHVVYVPDAASNAVALDDGSGRRAARVPDVIIAVTVTDENGQGAAPVDRRPATPPGPSASDLWIHLNLVDYAKQMMIPKMQSSGVLLVQRDTGNRSYDFTIRGTTYAVSGNSRQFESAQSPAGLLASLSLIEVLGRYNVVPYWRCIPGAKPDPVVLQELQTRFEALDTPARVRWLLETLSKYGFDLPPANGLDAAAKLAVDELIARFNFRRPGDYLDPGLFLDLYLNVPMTPYASGATGRHDAT
jgi:hypothetical protein